MIIVLVCCNASGFFVEPMLIYPLTQFKYFDKADIFEESFTTKSPNGWIDKSLFIKWLENVFVPKTAHLKKPVLLFLDGHVSHTSLEASKLCRDNDIILYGLLAHASHIIQPLDVGVFKSMKAQWREAVRQRNEKTITKKTFAGTFKEAYQRVTKDSALVNQAFRKCGLFPLDYHAIDKSKLVTGSSNATSTTTTPTPIDSETGALPTTSHQLIETTNSEPSSNSNSAADTSSQPVKDLPESLVKLMDFVVEIGKPKLELYKTRFSEGYDVENEEYDRRKHMLEECITGQVPRDAEPGTDGKKTPNPLEMPTIVRGKRQKKKTMPNFMSGAEFIKELENDELRKAEDSKRKEERKKTMEERAMKRKKDEEAKQERKRKRLEVKLQAPETSKTKQKKGKQRAKIIDEESASDETDDEAKLKRAQEEAIMKAKALSASLNEKDDFDSQADNLLEDSFGKGKDDPNRSGLDLGLDSILEEINSALMKEADTLMLD